LQNACRQGVTINQRFGGCGQHSNFVNVLGPHKQLKSSEVVKMKRYVIWSSALLVVVVIVAGIAVARAAGPGHRGWGGRGWGFHGPLGYVSHELNLNDAQKSQIKTLWQAERPAVAKLVRDLASECKELDSATTQGTFDESKAQAIAARQGETIANLLVEKERFKSKVYSTVLNADQRAKAEELQKKWESRLDHAADHLGTQPAEQ
jgi:Spy/CpxP family protein refolding chaperone